MRRNLGSVFFALGAFFLVAGLLVRFYAYPKLAIVPADQDSVTYLEAADATVFSINDMDEITTDLSIAATTRGDVKASEDAGGDTRVWTGTTTVKTAQGDILSQSANRTAFNGVTAEAVNCCGNFEESVEGEREAVSRKGLVFKFPFNTQKETYAVWDDTVGEAVDAKFVKEDEVQGLPVYVFEQVVPRTQVGTRDVPGSVVGETDDTVTAESYYANTRTYYIEPVTGAVVNRVEEQNATLAIDGEDRTTTTQGTIHYTDDQVSDMVKDLEPKASQLSAIRGIVPLGAGILGLVFLGLGFLFRRRQGA